MVVGVRLHDRDRGHHRESVERPEETPVVSETEETDNIQPPPPSPESALRDVQGAFAIINRAVISIGQSLYGVRAHINDGDRFAAWLEDNLRWDVGRAEQHISVAECFYNGGPFERIEPAALMALAGDNVRDGLRVKILARAADGAMISQSVAVDAIRQQRQLCRVDDELQGKLFDAA